MNLRSTLLAGATLLGLAGPAAAGDGMYIGLGAGWDGQNNVTVDQLAPPPASGQVTTNNGLIIAGSLGYKMPEFPVRLEFESGYDWHSVQSLQSGPTYSASGHSNVASELVNAVYDFPVAPGWNLSAGAGVGAGHVWFAPNFSGPGAGNGLSGNIAQVDKWGFMWQGIAGTSFELAPDADLFVEYHYRDAQAHAISFTPSGPVSSHSITENAVLAGVRFYLFPTPPMDGPPPPN